MNLDKLAMHLSRDTRARILIELENLGDEHVLLHGFEVQQAKKLLLDNIIEETGGKKQADRYLDATKSGMGF